MLAALALLFVIPGGRAPALACDPLESRAPATQKTTHVFAFDDDRLTFPGTDRDYSFGLSFRYGRSADSLPRARCWRRVLWDAGVILNGFTNDSLQADHVIRGERPFASLALATGRIVMLDATGEQAWVSELSIGMLGGDIIRRMQSEAHRFFRRATPWICVQLCAEPDGYRHQISRDGELTGLLRVALPRLIFESCSGGAPCTQEARGPRRFQIDIEPEARLGFYTDAAIGASMRLGRFQSRFWEGGAAEMQGPGTPSSMRMPDGARRTSSSAAHTAFDFSLFASAPQRLVGYNALLEGGFQRSEYVVASSDLVRNVTEYQIGAIGIWRRNSHQFGVTYAPFIGHSSEFSGLYARAHKWGRIQLSWE